MRGVVLSFLAVLSGTSLALEQKVLHEDKSHKTAQCKVRAWVRAPDLYPGAIIPGEARIVATGEKCDIVKWDVGLRFKESGTVRLRGDNFPKRHFRNTTCCTSDSDNSDIHESLLDVPIPMSFEPDVLADIDEMRRYQKAVRNPDVWKSYSQTRIAFDSRITLQTLEGENRENDMVQSFRIAIPNVNFPPTLDNRGPRFTSDDELTTAHEEQVFEFYVVVHLRNGAVIEQPAGYAAFIPSLRDHSLLSNVDETVIIPLDLPNELCRAGSDENASCSSECLRSLLLPRCERDIHAEIAQYELVLDNVRRDRTYHQGQKLEFNGTLRKTAGNGTEVPFELSARLDPYTNHTWASSIADTPAERAELSHDTSLSATQLKAKKVVKRSTVRHDRYDVEYPIFRPSVVPKEGLGEGVHVALQISNRALPTFDTTYSSYGSEIHITLSSRFMCDVKKSIPKSDSDYEASWSEELPGRYGDRFGEDPKLSGAMSWYEARIPITVLPSPPPSHPTLLKTTTTAKEKEPVHYLEPGADMPILFANDAVTPPPFPTSNPIIRAGDDAEIKNPGVRRSNRLNRQGSGHAGQIWNVHVALEEAKKIGLSFDELDFEPSLDYF